MKKKLKILITGSNGFIGRNLKEQLWEFYDITAPSSKELNLLDEEKVYSYLKKKKFNVVIDCATHNATVVSDKDLNKVFFNNLKMFFNLARCSKFFEKMFYFGSGAEYDKRYPIVKVREIDFDKRVPVDYYGFSKYIITKYIESANNIYNLRLFGCFGKYEDWRIRFISSVICRIIFDMNITISKNVYFDYLYIDDLVKIVRYFIDKKKIKYKEYNVCTGRKIDLVTLAKKIAKAGNKETRIKVLESGLKQEYTSDNSRLMAEIESLNFSKIDDSITELYHWYKQNKSLIDIRQIR